MNYFAFDTDRKNYGITMAEIAEVMGISTSTLYRWMNSHNPEREQDILDAVETIKTSKSR